MEMSFEDLKDQVITKVLGAEQGSEEIQIILADGRRFRMYHERDCCEYVAVEDVCGDISDLIENPILLAEEASNSEGLKPRDWSDSFTWTFYKLSTIKGSVTIRWLGESNGYYSESVTFVQVLP